MRYHLCRYKRVKVLESTVAKFQRYLQKAENMRSYYYSRISKKIKYSTGEATRWFFFVYFERRVYMLIFPNRLLSFTNLV